MRLAGVTVAVCLLLSGCGSGTQDTATTTPKPSPTTAADTAATPARSSTPAVATPTGATALQDLIDFQCYAGADGVWNSSGILQNDSKKTMTYQVTVFVGQADDKPAKAKTKQFVVSPEGSARIALAKLPAATTASRCHVQVLAR